MTDSETDLPSDDEVSAGEYHGDQPGVVGSTEPAASEAGTAANSEPEPRNLRYTITEKPPLSPMQQRIKDMGLDRPVSERPVTATDSGPKRDRMQGEIDAYLAGDTPPKGDESAAPEAVDTAKIELTRDEVEKIAQSFIEHIAQNWDTYKDNLPLLAKTMTVFDDFCDGINHLPEARTDHVFVSLYDTLNEDNLKEHFGDTYSPEIGRLIYDSWAFLIRRTPWKPREEPLDDTPEALMAAYPIAYPTREAADEAMKNEYRYADIDGHRMQIATKGTPVNYFRGFTTADEFPQQQAFLDYVRSHPRIKLGIETMQEEYALEREVAETKESIMTRLREIAALKAEASNDPVRLAELSAEFDQLSETQFTLDVDTLRAQKRQQQA